MDVVNQNVQRVLNNPYVMAILKVSLVLYAAQIAPKFPAASSLFDNTFVKIALIALMVYLANMDFQLAIIIAVIYVLGINALSGRGLLESYQGVEYTGEDHASFETDFKKLTTLLGSPVPPPFGTVLESKSDNYPGCNNVTVKDLLAIFDGDYYKMQNTLLYTYNELIHKLPDTLPNKDKLISMAHAAGIPLNVPLTDDNAPLIATYLLNVGFIITDSCRPPQ